ncbi:MAG: hypothetical protein GX214_02270 [Clostridiales bacterium]|nr:hypothetical protein [Clostridiales bacterium]
MDIIKDIFYTNKRVFKLAIDSFIKNWIIIFTGLFYSLATIILYISLPHFWILAGLVMIIVTSALISNYLHLINCIITRNKFDIQDFKEGFTIYLNKVWGISFIGWFGSLVVSTLIMPIFSRGNLAIELNLIINFLVITLLNALPESVYQKMYNPWDTIVYTFEFIKENWIEWFVPNIILSIVLYLLTGSFLSGVFKYYIPLRFNILSPRVFLIYILGQIIFSFTMIYRGYLFDILSTSTRRKRLFMREF